jgi:hypothetical protein
MTERVTVVLLFIFAAISVYVGFFADSVAYFLGIQFNECILLLLVAINTTGFARTLAVTLLILATFELIDEIAGRNTFGYYNDYIPIASATIYLIWNYLRKK